MVKSPTVSVLLVSSPRVVEPRQPGLSQWFHIALPLRGCFLWHDRDGDVLAGPNHVLFVPAGREFRIAHPVEADLSLIIIPRRVEIDRIARSCGVDPEVPSYRTISGAAQLSGRSLIWAAQRGGNDLDLEELALAFLAHLRPSRTDRFGLFDQSTRRTLTRSKEYLHANMAQPISLGDVAAAVGVNAVYLTNLFKAREGVSLHRYLLRLRLAAGLEALPETADLSGLAHDLGFSSHAHLSSAFKARFSHSPSRLRHLVAKAAAPRHFEALPLCAARSGTN